MSTDAAAKAEPIKIDQPIASVAVVKDMLAEPAVVETAPVVEPEYDKMHEGIKRGEVLEGSTYKIKTPDSDHALYITINDKVLNEGTEHETRQPFEIFINSKNMDHFQWIVALTRITSAVFRKGGDVTFLVEEMRAVFDPKGGYFKKGGVYMPSLVAEIGSVIEDHLKKIGVIQSEEMHSLQKQILAEKREEYEAMQAELDSKQEAEQGDDSAGEFPAGATLCNKCNTKAVIIMDGCATCLSCGNSKCG